MPFLGPEAFAIFTTAALWYWILKRLNSVTRNRREIRKECKLASISFVGYLVVELLAYFSKDNSLHLPISLLCATNFITFAILNPGYKEGFWMKKRNKFVGLALAFAVTAFAHVSFLDPIHIALVFSLFTAHICNSNTNTLLKNSIQDIEGLHAKLLSLESKLKLLGLQQTEKKLKQIIPHHFTS